MTQPNGLARDFAADAHDWPARAEVAEPFAAGAGETNIEDAASCRRYLAARAPVESTALEILSGGVSNRAVMVHWPDGNAWVLKQALPKLRVQADWFSSPDRITVEAKALRLFNRILPADATPVYLFEDPANHLLAMEAVPAGNANWKSLLFAGAIRPSHFEQFGKLLASIHCGTSLLPRRDLEDFADTTHFEALRLEPYYGFSARRVPASFGFLQSLSEELLRNKISLVHGDFSPKNTLIHEDHLTLLDFEVVHWGDPAFDVGFAMAHFLSKAHHMANHRARMTAGALIFWMAYQEQIELQPWTTTLEARCVRNTLGCLLARAVGKSPLEYLDAQEVARQRDVVVELMLQPPSRIPDLIRDFIHGIEAYASH